MKLKGEQGGTKIKICGLTRKEDIGAVNDYSPEYIGFVFAVKSRRYISYGEAAKLKKMLKPDIKAVGVFVNEEVKIVSKHLCEGLIDMAQLHGNEDENYISELKGLTDKPIIKAFHVKNDKELSEAVKCKADYLLFDSPTAGSGSAFDWSLLDNTERAFFLAGGLSPYNVAAAVKKLKPFAVDVSSGVEKDGIKDREEIKKFISAVRNAERKEQYD